MKPGMLPQPDAPDLQEEAWESFVQEVRAGKHPDFKDQWEAYTAIFARRRMRHGPPPAWKPAPEEVAASNLGALMKDLRIGTYADLHAWSVRNRAEFWAKAIERLGIVFSDPPRATLADTEDARHPTWLPGAAMNCTDSCFTAEPAWPAIISAREGTDELVTTSYRDLERMVDAVARGLRNRGFGQDDAIGLYMPMTIECVAAYLGVVRAGCRVISIADSFAPRELARRLSIGKASGLITVSGYARGGKRIHLYEKVKKAQAPRAIVIPARPEQPPTPREGDLLWNELISAGRDDEPFTADQGGPDRIMNVLFSSGTTADPKAIPWTHATPIKCAMDGHFHQNISAGDVVAWPTNIGWMMGPWLIFASLINRATIALYDGLPTGPRFARFVQDAGVTMLGVVPSLVRAWRASWPDEAIDWSRIQVFSSTGEPSNREDYLWLMSRTGYRAPVIEYCGGTEIGGGYVTGTIAQPASPAAFTTPALGLDMMILHEDGRPVDEGEAGEVFLVPPAIGLSQTLLNRDHDKVYHEGCPTGPNGEILRRHGDRIVRLPGGWFRAQGRSDDTMNLGGIKVSSLELEQVVVGHPAVKECAAIAVQPEGEGAEQLVLYAVTGRRIDAAKLREQIRELIARELNPLFKVHDLVIIDEMPRTASNKLMRRSLRDLYKQSQEDPGGPSPETAIGYEMGPEVQLNLNVRGLPNSSTLAINERSDQLRSQGRHIYKLGLGQSPFPVPEPLVEALRKNAHQKDYLPVMGLPALRAAVAENHGKAFGMESSPESVLVGPGSKELMFLLQLVYYGDLVIPTPTWVSYEPQARIIGRHVHFLPTRARNNWKVTPEQLDELCSADPTRPRILILNYPSNPTGGTFTEPELRDLADLARRYRLILLSDEIYGKLHHEGKHHSIVPFYPQGTIFSGGLSKWCGAGGWRLGLFVFPERLRWLQEAMASVASETFTSTSAPIQHAAVTAFRPNAEIDRYLANSRRILAALGRTLATMLNEAGIKVRPPAGGFYLFPDMRHLAPRMRARGIRGSDELCERLLEETGVAILPGRAFGRPPDELTVRLAYVNFDGKRALAAAATVPDGQTLGEAFLRENCGETLESIERLCDWVGG